MRPVALLAIAFITTAGCNSGADPSLDAIARVVSFTPGDGAGYGADMLPGIIEGPPHGAGTAMGSLDTLSLGRGGEIVVELARDLIDRPGPDFIVFENPFYISGSPDRVFVEPGFVSVSEDGASFADFPCDPSDAPDYPGCAGLRPVFSNPDTGISPTDVGAAGGDAFDLATIGVGRARFVKIRDAGMGAALGGGKDGFDLDAIVGLH